MATFTTPCYGSRGRSLRLLSLGIEGVNRSGQVDGESFFVSSSAIYMFFCCRVLVILSYMISNTIPLLHPKCNTLFKTVKPKFLCQSAIVVYSILVGRSAGPYSYTCHSHHRRSWWLLHASFVSSYVGAPNIDPWPGSHP